MKKKAIFLALLLTSATFCFAEVSSKQDQLSPHTTDSTSATEFKRPSRVALFLHIGVADIGFGTKIRFSKENGIYMTIDLRYQAWGQYYFRLPAMLYLGGNHIHLTGGVTIINGITNPYPGDSVGPEASFGLNYDFNTSWGVDLLAFTPLAGNTSASILLDFRYTF